MADGGKKWNKLKNWKPPVFLSILLAAVLTALTLAVLLTEEGKAVPEAFLYILYIAAFLSIAAAVWAVILLFLSGKPEQILKNFAHKTAFTSRLYDDLPFRIIVSAYASFMINVLLAAAKGIAGIVTGSYWLLAFALYYIVLSITKMVLLSGNRNISRISDEKKRHITEWKAYRLSGGLLILLAFVLEGIVGLIVEEGYGFRYDGILIYVVAMYDFLCLFFSIQYLIRNRRRHTPTVAAIKVISLTTSLVSILSLQTAMFAAFGSNGERLAQIRMNIATGIGVGILILLCGAYMLRNAVSKIKELQNE